MLSCMVMQLVRGEAGLQPLAFISHYLLIVPPLLVFVSVIAILFESIRFLSGRFGDAVYFFLWMVTFVITVQFSSNSIGPNWAANFDTTGLGFVMNQVRSITGKDGLAIGSTEYNMTKPPVVFHGITLPPEWILPRLSSLLFPLPLLLLALFLFHRFDPSRLKASLKRKRRSWIAFFDDKLKFVTKLIPAGGRLSGGSFLGSIVEDSMLTLRLYPALTLILVGLVIVSLLSPAHRIQGSILPVIFGVIIIAVSDIASREKRTGLLNSVFAMPGLKPNFVLWKFSSTLLLVLVFALIPMIKLSFADTSAAVSLLIGCAFTAALATSLGLLSANPKAFIVLFGMFWYVVLNDGGKNPSFDFAGWYGTATPAVQMAYFGIAATALATTFVLNAMNLKRNY